MTKILWVSRHPILEVEVRWLEDRFGEIKIDQISSFGPAEELIEKFKKGGYDEILVIAPLTVIRKICEAGIHPLWIQAEEASDSNEADFTYRGKHYRFVEIRRIRGIKVELEEV